MGRAQDRWSHPFILQGSRKEKSLLCPRPHSQGRINPRSPGTKTVLLLLNQGVPTNQTNSDSYLGVDAGQGKAGGGGLYNHK